MYPSNLGHMSMLADSYWLTRGVNNVNFPIGIRNLPGLKPLKGSVVIPGLNGPRTIRDCCFRDINREGLSRQNN